MNGRAVCVARKSAGHEICPALFLWNLDGLWRNTVFYGGEAHVFCRRLAHAQQYAVFAAPERRGQSPQTQREIAERCGISRSYVSRIEKKALQTLQEALSDYAP